MRNVLRITTTCALAGALLALGRAPAAAPRAPWQEEGEKESSEGGEKKEEEKAKDEKKEKEEEDRWFAIVGGDVYGGEGTLLRGATILAKNGVIEEIGYDLWLPPETEKLDARGLRVYPGLVSLGATTRLTRGLFGAPEADAERPHEDVAASLTDPLHAVDEIDPGSHLDDPAGTPGPLAAGGENAEIEDTFDPFSEFLVLALASGITSAEQSDAAVKLRRYTIDDVLMREKYLTSVPWSLQNPASIRSAKERFDKAARYLREYREWEDKEDKSLPEPDKKAIDTNTLRILRGERLARFNNDSREELLGIARLAQRYGFRPVIFGCMEGWTVADELGRAGAFAVITPRTVRPKEEELVRDGGSSIENAARLHAAGVQVAVVPGNTSVDLGGITGQDLLHLPVEAAFAVRGGLPEQAALESLTIVPARILGVESRIGTLEPGKDLDAIVTDGDVLHYQTFVQYAVVYGKLVYDKQEEIFYAHIRPRPELPPLDPGEAAPETETPAPEPAKGEAEKGSDEGDEGADQGTDEAGEGEKDEEGG